MCLDTYYLLICALICIAYHLLCLQFTVKNVLMLVVAINVHLYMLLDMGHRLLSVDTIELLVSKPVSKQKPQFTVG